MIRVVWNRVVPLPMVATQMDRANVLMGRLWWPEQIIVNVMMDTSQSITRIHVWNRP